MTKKFEWTPELLGKEFQKIALPDDATKPEKVIGELIAEYETEFWKTHSKDRKGLYNWINQYWKYLKKLPQNVALTKDALKQALESTEPNSETRNKLVWQLKRFCDYCGCDFSNFIDSYDTGIPKRKRRNPPSDSEVVEGFFKISSPLSKYAKSGATTSDQWGWIYGMLATYGLRPHELWAIDLEAFIAPSNIRHLVSLKPEQTDGTKTGERNCGIPPLHSEWVELFDLKTTKLPEFNGTLIRKVQNITDKFSDLKIGFKPYDLRHCYAIRGHKLMLPIRTMADYLGHSVSEHEKTYQKWMNQDANLEIYEKVVLGKQSEQTEVELLKARIAELEIENALLKSENAELKNKVSQLNKKDELAYATAQIFGDEIKKKPSER